MQLEARVFAMALAALASAGLSVAIAGSEVRVLYTGDPYPGITPYIFMRVEPLLQVTAVQASRQHYAGISVTDIKRAIRLHMPRTYQSLVGSYDVVIISDANVGSFTSDHHHWFKRSVEEGGVGLVMVGGYETYGGATGNPDWGSVPVGDALPVDTVSGLYWGGPLTILDTEHSFMSSLPWRPDLPFMRDYESNIVKPRDGARVLAVVTIGPWGGRSYAGWRNAFFSTWEFSNGTVFAMTGDWTPAGGWLFLQWDYLPDFATNLMLYCAKKPVPQDIGLVHSVRNQMMTLAYRRAIFSSLIDFVEKFGANTKKLLEVAREVDEIKESAASLYLEQSYAEALDEAGRALDAMDVAEALAEKIRAEALLWIHMAEWLVFTATSILCGLVVWSLMVRRRLYREVVTTKFAGR